MVNKEQKEKRSTDELLEEAAEKGARKALTGYIAQEINYYRAMEDLLRAYPKRLHLMEHPEEFDFFPSGRSKDISVAPPRGSGVVDKIEVAEMFTESRKRAYEQDLFWLRETQYAIAPFVHMPEFIVIRMFYFNEDVHGNAREKDAKRLTWEDIAEELDGIGIHKSVSVIRGWRSRLVRDMTVMLFGAQGAMSINRRESSKSKKGKGDKNAAEVEDPER